MSSFHKSIVVREELVKINSSHLPLLIMELQLWVVFIVATAKNNSGSTGVEAEAPVVRAAINR